MLENGKFTKVNNAELQQEIAWRSFLSE